MAKKVVHEHVPSGFFAFVTYIGALVYFINNAEGFWQVIFAFLQAAVWPGYVVYHSLLALGV